MTKEEFIARALREGANRQSAENTWALRQKVERILGDRDLSSEMQKGRLTNLIIDEIGSNMREGDRAIAAWLRQYHGNDALAVEIEAGDHWKWWQSHKPES